MPDDWKGRIPRTRGPRRKSRAYTQNTGKLNPKTGRPRSNSGNSVSKTADVLKGMGNVSKSAAQTAAKGIGKGVGSMAKGVGSVAKGVGSLGKGVKSAMTGKSHYKQKNIPSNISNIKAGGVYDTISSKPPPIPSAPPPTRPSNTGNIGNIANSSSPRASNQSNQSSHSNQSQSPHSPHAQRSREDSSTEDYSDYLRRQPKMVESKLSDRDRDFLVECTLLPTETINKISVGLQLDYVPNLGDSNDYSKPLVIAVLSKFSLGMIFPDLGYSIWRTKIGRMRAEQFFSVQVGDIDVLADTLLKDQLQSQMAATFDAALSQLRKEQVCYNLYVK